MSCKSKITSTNIRIDSPCEADWSAMDAKDVKDQARFCSLCSTDVHDLSSMGQDQAVKLMSGDATLCVRYRCTPDGEVRFADSVTPRDRRLHRPWLRRSVQLVAIAALSLVGGRAQADEGELASPVPDVVGDATSWVLDRVTEFVELLHPEDESELIVKGEMGVMDGASFEPVPASPIKMGRTVYRPPVEALPLD
jgi:hypothetical protein